MTHNAAMCCNVCKDATQGRLVLKLAPYLFLHIPHGIKCSYESVMNFYLVSLFS